MANPGAISARMTIMLPVLVYPASDLTGDIDILELSGTIVDDLNLTGTIAATDITGDITPAEITGTIDPSLLDGDLESDEIGC